MPALDIPFFGTLVLCLILISASYTMAVAVGAGQGRPHLLPSARWGTYATCALVLVAVCVLAYAFQVHDFRIRYVARYSDRSMPWWYLIASLWGGQDGSLLWWAFLLSGYTFFATRWLRGRYTEQTDIRYGAARGWVDAIIPPHETRHWLMAALDLLPPISAADFRTGVLQV